MPTDRATVRRVALALVPCLVLAAPSAVSARPPTCGAVPVIGTSGAVLYWTRGTGCAADARDTGGEEAGPSDSGPVTRNGWVDEPTPEPMPEARPVRDAVAVSG